MPRREPETVSADDALHAVSTFSGWVNNADTKIGFLATALTVLTAALVRQRVRLEVLLGQPVSGRGRWAIAMFAVSVAMLVPAAWFLFRALRPRLDNDKASRFAFPYLANADLGSLDPDPVKVRREAWIQAQTLSKIVLRKYTGFRRSLTFGFAAGIAFVGWLILVPTQ